jgi:Ni,Fe-hydrogenase III small subunit/formate hydrogenlyase subunit 6/NADH:ubiquinone oxidoreductase subunit I
VDTTCEDKNMINAIVARIHQKYRTSAYPNVKPVLPDRFRGMPSLDQSRCVKNCTRCIEQCPSGAIARQKTTLAIDLGLCLFCGKCADECPSKAIGFTRDYRLSVSRRADCLFTGEQLQSARALERSIKRILGRSLKLRQVSAGGCNACEADTNVLNTLVFDLGRFGIQFVASPRHSDGLLITGPVPQNMKLALQKTYDAVPHPKIVIAVGACAIGGGIYRNHPEVNNGADGIVPVDLYVPGCPPHPMTILDGLLRLLGRFGHKLKNL